MVSLRQSLPPVLLTLFVLYGGFLLVESARNSFQKEEPFLLRHASKTAIFKIDTPEMLEHILDHGLVIETQIPDATTLVRITGHQEPFSLSKIRSNSEVLILSPGGIWVDADAQLDAEVNYSDTLSGTKERNQYALAIQEGGSIRASQPYFRNGDSYLIPISSKNEDGVKKAATDSE